MSFPRLHLSAAAAATLLALSACGGSSGDNGVPVPAPDGTGVTMALLETTDIHTNVLSYDYYKLADDPSVGLERTATLIAQARKDYPNNVLLDDGDTIQGTALSDYQALVSPVPCSQTLAVYKVMNAIGYDGASWRCCSWRSASVSQVREDYRFRVAGMARTFVPLIAASVRLLYGSFAAG